MKISVIVPVYNGEAFIAETLDSLVGQTLDDFEMIVVNDGSTDGTEAIVKKYAEKYDNIVYIYQNNSGVSAARNNGIDHARGKYICFLDCDDIYTPETLEGFYNRLEETNAELAICSQLNFGYGGENFNRFAKELSETESINCYDKRLLWNFLLMNKCFSLQKINEHGIRFTGLKYSEDAVFCMDYILKVMPKTVGVKNALFKYRRHTPEEGFSVSQRITYPLLKDCCTAYRCVYDRAMASLKAKNCPCPDQTDYISEIIYKTYFTLVTEFYRLMWKADDETLELLDSELKYVLSLTEDSDLSKNKLFHKDIGELICSKKEAAKHPCISVIAEKCEEGFFASIYEQTMPLFEMIVPEGTVIPKEYSQNENIVVLPKKSFKKSAKKAAKGKLLLVLSGKPVASTAFLKLASLMKKNKKLRMLPNFAIKHGTFLICRLKRLR